MDDILTVIAYVVIYLIFMGVIIKLLWNYALVPAIGVSNIGFFQALGLYILANIFFKLNYNITKKNITAG